MQRLTKENNMIENMASFLKLLPIAINPHSSCAQEIKSWEKKRKSNNDWLQSFASITFFIFMVGIASAAITFSIPKISLLLGTISSLLLFGFIKQDIQTTNHTDNLREQSDTLLYNTFSDMKTLTYFFKCLLLFPSLANQINLKQEFEVIHSFIREKDIEKSATHIKYLIELFYEHYEKEKHTQSMNEILKQHDLVLPQKTEAKEQTQEITKSAKTQDKVLFAKPAEEEILSSNPVFQPYLNAQVPFEVMLDSLAAQSTEHDPIAIKKELELPNKVLKAYAYSK